MPGRSDPRRAWRLLLAPLLVAVLALAGCSTTADSELEDQLATIAGVTQTDVDASRVKVTLAADLAAADAGTTILAVRERVVAEHPLGTDVELVVVLPAGERDLGGAQPWNVYSFASWSEGAVGEPAFEQQAGFFASLADWETPLTGPALIEYAGFRVTGVAGEAPAETDAPVEGEGDGTTDGTETAEPVLSEQVVTLALRQRNPADNLPADVAAAIAELADLWVASGGGPEAITIS